MHLIETYATHCGLKIDEPSILEKFYPLDIDKYITFHPFSKPSKTYDYWQTVLDFLIPILEKENIEILQIGGTGETVFAGCHGLNGATTSGQTAYILRNAMLHLGCDSFPVHIASVLNKKMVVVYPNTHLQNVRPYWGDTKKQKLICINDTKPSFQLSESPKTINEIRPEEIVKSVCDYLNLEFDFPYETIYIGEAFSQKTIENIPNQTIIPKELGVDTAYIRMDIDFNEGALDKQLTYAPCSIVTNRPINPELLKKHKPQIHELIYVIEQDNDDPNFPKFLESERINYTIMTRLPREIADKKKLNYMDLEHAAILKVKEYKEDIEEIKKEGVENLYYMSSRLVLSKGDSYYNESDIETHDSITSTGEIKKVKDHEIFWENIHKSMILKRLD